MMGFASGDVLFALVENYNLSVALVPRFESPH